MIVHKIHSMQWADKEKAHVHLVADTATGLMEQITTPYGEASIIWQWVQAFPADQIDAYVEPEVVDMALVGGQQIIKDLY